MRAVTVLVIAGTGRPYLKEALHSLQRQEGVDWEAIVLDACFSEDDSKKVQAQLISDGRISDGRIKLVKYNAEKVLYPPFASRKWNFALRYATGDLIAFLDDDDMKEDGWLRTMCEPLFSDKNLAVTLCGGNTVDVVGRRGGKLFGEPSLSLSVLLAPNFVTTGQMVVRRSVIDEIGGFDETLGCAEDWEFCIRLSKYNWRYITGTSCLKRDSIGNACYHEEVVGYTQDALRKTIRKHVLAPDNCHACGGVFVPEDEPFVWAVPKLGFRLWHYTCAVERQKQA